ncbi:hypothetical protein RFZ45_06740, partial [Acinetobacter baumannii]|nr:hypothetical protein [Acinetobacter baumannii]
NGETLVKNIILLAAIIYLIYSPTRPRRLISQRNAWLVSIYTWIYSIALTLYSFHYLPIIEFTPYKVGADIR